MQIFSEKEYNKIIEQSKKNIYTTDSIIPFFTNKNKIIKNYVYETSAIYLK